MRSRKFCIQLDKFTFCSDGTTSTVVMKAFRQDFNAMVNAEFIKCI